MDATRTALKTVATLVVTAALALTGGGVATASPAVAQTQAPATTSTNPEMLGLAPVAIQSFEWVQGKQQWVQPSAERLTRTVFLLDSSGGFAMVQPDGYPTVVGTIDQNGTFTAQYSSTVGNTGSTTVEVSGQVAEQQGGEIVMNLTYVAGATTAAVINGTSFGDSRTKAYHATLTLQTVQV